MTIRYLSAGESHGPELTAIIEGMPSNLEIDLEAINYQLARRQKGHGRGGRMAIENDQAYITAGIRFKMTTGAPIGLKVINKDWINWSDKMAHFDMAPLNLELVTKARPGHADLSGALKYQQEDIRNILERASARETAIRVASGAICRQLLENFNIKIYSHVLQIGSVKLDHITRPTDVKDINHWYYEVENSPVRTYNQAKAADMMAEIDSARIEGDSIGGIIELIITGLPAGIGSYVHWEHKLDSRLARVAMSVQAMKAVEFGAGFDLASLPGSQVHDPIYYSQERSFYRKTNNAGGIEGGMSNGEAIIMRVAMKPIPTLYKPLDSVDIHSKESYKASIERSDSCAVPAAGVVLENALAIELATIIKEHFTGNSLTEMQAAWDNYLGMIDKF